jgi:hypothetical protein
VLATGYTEVGVLRDRPGAPRSSRISIANPSEADSEMTVTVMIARRMRRAKAKSVPRAFPLNG